MFNKKVDYFYKKLEGVERMIWDLELKRFKSEEKREQFREQYDGQKFKLDSVTHEQEDKKEQLNKDELARFDDQKVLIQKEIDRLEGWIKGLDLEVVGSQPTSDFPDGVQGINAQIEALHELKITIKNYLKSL